MSELITFPNQTIFGAGAVSELKKYLPESGAILFVTGNHAKKTLLPKILADFENRTCGTISDISPELPIEDVDRICIEARKIDAKIVVAIGGGSVIDAGKVAAALTPLDGDVWDYFYNRRQIAEKGLFFAALPTTSGTGSEATQNSVLCDHKTGIKQAIRNPLMVPDVAIVDPELTWGCPPETTANSGLDAITQAIESVVSNRKTGVSYALAIQALKFMLHGTLVKAVANDVKAREDMAYGSMTTGLGFALSGLGAVHGLAHPIGALFHIAHGKACAILLPTIMRWNKAYLEDVAKDLGFASADEFIEHIVLLCKELSIPEKIGVSLDDVQVNFIVENCRSGSMACNPRELSDEDIVKILEDIS